MEILHIDLRRLLLLFYIMNLQVAEFQVLQARPQTMMKTKRLSLQGSVVHSLLLGFLRPIDYRLSHPSPRESCPRHVA